MRRGKRVGHLVGGGQRGRQGQWGRSKGAGRGERGSEPLGVTRTLQVGERTEHTERTERSAQLCGVSRSHRGQSRRVTRPDRSYETPSGLRAKADCRKQA